MSIFKSPSLIQFNFLKISPKIHVSIAGKTKHTNNIPNHIFIPASGIAVIIPKGPTNPQVPIPAPIGTFSNMHGGDLDWIRDKRLCGVPEGTDETAPDYERYNQRGVRQPAPNGYVDDGKT